MDIVLVYDPSVAEKYGIMFFPNIYPYPAGVYTEAELDYDICFAGGNKGRENQSGNYGLVTSLFASEYLTITYFSYLFDILCRMGMRDIRKTETIEK